MGDRTDEHGMVHSCETTLSVSTPTILNNGCLYCGDLYYHGAARCPSVRAIEYHPNGTIKRIEFVR